MTMSPFSQTSISTAESSYPPSPRSILEGYFMDVEDIQDIDAISIASSVSSSVSTTSQKVFSTFMSGLSHPKRKLSQLLVPEIDFDFTFPSLENVFPS
ncbi:hypothetical protein QM012_005755 [Aureobasidium pullulans]|uniref:Uncharacterized protein n=1 Tax=Aureobasidium pullulans TaxID=5580 RepID=A0ABR0TR07_AURPU